MKVDLIREFSFDYGTKNIKDCTRDELLFVIDYLANEIEFERNLHKSTRNIFTAYRDRRK